MISQLANRLSPTLTPTDLLERISLLKTSHCTMVKIVLGLLTSPTMHWLLEACLREAATKVLVRMDAIDCRDLLVSSQKILRLTLKTL